MSDKRVKATALALALFVTQLLILVHSVDHIGSPAAEVCLICLHGRVDKTLAGPVLVLAAPRFEFSEPFAEHPVDLITRTTHSSFPRGPPSLSLL